MKGEGAVGWAVIPRSRWAWVQCLGLARGGGFLRRLAAAGTPNRDPAGAGRARCLLLADGSPRRDPGGMWLRRWQQQRRRRNQPLSPHCCPLSVHLRGCVGRSCFCAQGCLLTRPAPQTRPRTPSAAGHPRGGLGGQHLARRRRRSYLNLTPKLFLCWKGREDWFPRLMPLVSRGGAHG